MVKGACNGFPTRRIGRYCDMVREMSKRVQFIFITHNKMTMELSDHLMGVTMHEPGVSRLVSVDLNEAARLVEVEGLSPA